MSAIRHDGRDVGVVGVEITLRSVQKLLIDFAAQGGVPVRCILVRAFYEEAEDGDSTQIVYRALIDTQARAVSDRWDAELVMPRVSELGEEVASYFSLAVAPGTLSRSARRINGRIVAHAKLDREGLYLIAIR
jgi:hypothetical protein